MKEKGEGRKVHNEEGINLSHIYSVTFVHLLDLFGHDLYLFN